MVLVWGSEDWGNLSGHYKPCMLSFIAMGMLKQIENIRVIRCPVFPLTTFYRTDELLRPWAIQAVLWNSLSQLKTEISLFASSGRWSSISSSIFRPSSTEKSFDWEPNRFIRKRTWSPLLRSNFRLVSSPLNNDCPLPSIHVYSPFRSSFRTVIKNVGCVGSTARREGSAI